MVISLDDKNLINDCIAGKRDAQYQLYKKYSKAMFNICLRMVTDQSEAEDVLQNSFIDVFAKLKYFRFESTPGAWIKRIVVNNCINYLRKSKIEFQSADYIPEMADTSENDDVDFNIDIVKKAINVLPDGYRMIFCLYTMEGYDHGEIAEILNISESTSKSQYSRARSKLYEIMKSNGSIDLIYQ